MKDFSLIGARLITDSYEDVKKGEIIEPVTLTLFTHSSDNEQLINIPEATIARSKNISKNRTEIGISFEIPPSDLKLLDVIEVYLKLRRLEEAKKDEPGK